MSRVESVGGVRRLARLLDTRAVGLLAGAYRSARLGAGLAFVELRPYQPGDDVRAIDWKVTARQRRPFVRVHAAERSQMLWLVVDTSARMAAGIPGRTPGDVARETATWLAAAALHNGDRVGLALGSAAEPTRVSPRSGRGQAAPVAAKLAGLRFEATTERLDQSVEPLTRHRRRALIAVISDFRTSRPLQPWRMLARHHDLLPIRIADARDVHPPRAGLIAVRDPETRRTGWIDLNHPVDRGRLLARSSQHDEAYSAWCRSLGVVGLRISTDESSLAALTRGLGERSRRSRHSRPGRRLALNHEPGS